MAQVVLWALPGEWEQVELFAPDLDDRIATRVRPNPADSGLRPGNASSILP